MRKELVKSKNKLSEEIHNYNRLTDQYEISINQAKEKKIKYDLEMAKLYVDIS